MAPLGALLSNDGLYTTNGCPFPYMNDDCADTYASQFPYLYRAVRVAVLIVCIPCATLLMIGIRGSYRKWGARKMKKKFVAQMQMLAFAQTLLCFLLVIDPFGWDDVVTYSYDNTLTSICSVTLFAMGILQSIEWFCLMRNITPGGNRARLKLVVGKKLQGSTWASIMVSSVLTMIFTLLQTIDLARGGMWRALKLFMVYIAFAYYITMAFSGLRIMRVVRQSRSSAASMAGSDLTKFNKAIRRLFKLLSTISILVIVGVFLQTFNGITAWSEKVDYVEEPGGHWDVALYSLPLLLICGANVIIALLYRKPRGAETERERAREMRRRGLTVTGTVTETEDEEDRRVEMPDGSADMHMPRRGSRLTDARQQRGSRKRNVLNNLDGDDTPPRKESNIEMEVAAEYEAARLAALKLAATKAAEEQEQGEEEQEQEQEEAEEAAAKHLRIAAEQGAQGADDDDDDDADALGSPPLSPKESQRLLSSPAAADGAAKSSEAHAVGAAASQSADAPGDVGVTAVTNDDDDNDDNGEAAAGTPSKESGETNRLVH